MIQRYGLFGAYDDWKMEPDSDGEFVLFSDHVAALAAAMAEVARLREMVTDPNAVHVNMLRGAIAKPTLPQVVHVYGSRELFDYLSRTYGVARAALQDRPTPTDGGKG